MYSEAIILVAGAEPTDRETILQTVGDQCHVVASQTVEDALAHRTDEVDLVITEIKSTRLDGMDLMRRWKSRHPSTPFVMLAEQSDAAGAIEAMKSGASDCVVKPIDADELRTTVLHLISSTSDNGASTTDRGSNGGHRRKTIDIPPDTSLEDLERAAVEQALVQHHGNRTHAARMLGISVRTLQRKLKAWGMPILSFPSPALNHCVLMTSSSLERSNPMAHVH
jgi:DNA-binding NtrC family response regulator